MDTQRDPTPGPLTQTRATSFPESVLLEWGAPAEADRPKPSKYYIVRLRVEDRATARLEKTTFVHAATRTFADTGLAPGRYRYLVGALGGAGSGPASTIEVDVAVSS